MTTREPNPYRPGFNQAPVVFAGRGDILDGATEALAVAAHDGRTPRPIVLLGPRGVGKTVTLGEIADLAAERYAWPAVHVEAKSAGGLIHDLAARLAHAARTLQGQAAEPRQRRTRVTGGLLEARAFGVGGELHWESVPGPEAGPDLARSLGASLAGAMTAATERGAGVVLTLDELQNARNDEIHVLAGVLQETVPLGWPLVTAIAALPSLRAGRGRHGLPTYLERAEWYDLDTLGRTDALRALTGPARQAGRPMTRTAADRLVRFVGGYPYALQVAGHYAWRASSGSASITAEHVRRALPRIEADLEHLFRGRWDDASPREREYLAALAEVSRGRPGNAPAPGGGDVARELGLPTTKVSYLRDRLLKKGTIYRDQAAGLHFITPGMAEWVRSHTAATR